jgi:hypothetical protein
LRQRWATRVDSPEKATPLDSLTYEQRDIVGLQVHAVKCLDCERNLLQEVLASSGFGELGTGSIIK